MAVDTETRLSPICGQLGRAVSQIAGGMVAIVESSALASPESQAKKPRSHGVNASWRRHSSEVTENVWRIPAALFCAGYPGCDLEGITPEDVTDLHATFDHVLLAGGIQDPEVPLFSNICGAAVLVLSANRTRREAALQAKEHLLRHNVQLLGTILTDRVLQIPEQIYKQL